MLKKPEGLTPEASEVWDKYLKEMEIIQTMYLKIAKTDDGEAFNHVNAFVTLCSNICGQYLEAQLGTEH